MDTAEQRTSGENQPPQGLFFCAVKEANSIERDLPPGRALISRQRGQSPGLWEAAGVAIASPRASPEGDIRVHVQQCPTSQNRHCCFLLPAGRGAARQHTQRVPGVLV